VKIKNVGQSSFTVQVSFESSKGPHAVVETTQVFCDKKLKSKISIPEEIKANLKQFSL
jgi:acyl-CoA thioesterase FadM